MFLQNRLVRSVLVLGVLLVGTGLVTGCETSQDETYANAQTCLDAATTTTQANTCAAMVQNDSSPKASLIRCSANFVAQGLTGSRLGNAFEALKSNSGNSNASATMLSYMVFNNELTGNDVTTTVANCQASQVLSMYRLATAVQLASQIALLASAGGTLAADLDPSSPSFNPADLQPALANISAQSAPDVGNLALNADSVFCGNGSNFEGQDICNKLNAAVVSGDPTTIGNQLLTLLQAAN